MNPRHRAKYENLAEQERLHRAACFADMKDWLAKVDSRPLEKPVENADGGVEVPQSWWDACCMVGDYSEAFVLCSYNDYDVLRLLLSGDMNEEAQRILGDSLSCSGFRSQMRQYFREDGKYAEQLMAVVEQAGGWPTGYPFVERITPYAASLGFTEDGRPVNEAD